MEKKVMEYSRGRVMALIDKRFARNQGIYRTYNSGRLGELWWCHDL